MRRLLQLTALFGAVAVGAGAAALATHTSQVEEHVVPWTIGGVTGAVTITDTDELPHETVTVTETTPTEPPPPTDPPPPPGGDSLVLVDETFNCSSYPQPVSFDLVKVTIRQQTSRQDAMHTGPECTGRIGRLEVDTWNADGIKVHPGTHDLTVEGGYLRNHGVFDPTVHVDGIQAMGGQRVTFRDFLIDTPFASNASMFIAQGGGGRELPTDIICDGCTIRRSLDRNRALRIYTSLRSGARNSTIYWCGDGPECGAGDAVSIDGSAQEPVDENNTIRLYSEG